VKNTWALTWYCQCNSSTDLWVSLWLISYTAVHTTMRRIHRWDYILLYAVNLCVVSSPAVLPVSCLLYVTCESDRLSSEHTSIRNNTNYRFGSLCETSKQHTYYNSKWAFHFQSAVQYLFNYFQSSGFNKLLFILILYEAIMCYNTITLRTYVCVCSQSLVSYKSS